MIRLTLMRHANALWKDPQVADFERPLNRRGSSEAETMSRRLLSLHIIPTVLLCSTALRAQQTADIVARELNLPGRNVRYEEDLYLASAADILQVIQGTGPRIDSLMIVGHNPGITDLARSFTTNLLDDLATAAFCSLNFDTSSWSELQAPRLRSMQCEVPPAGLFARWA